MKSASITWPVVLILGLLRKHAYFWHKMTQVKTNPVSLYSAILQTVFKVNYIKLWTLYKSRCKKEYRL